jgi:hypothetical protein
MAQEVAQKTKNIIPAHSNLIDWCNPQVYIIAINKKIYAGQAMSQAHKRHYTSTP